MGSASTRRSCVAAAPAHRGLGAQAGREHRRDGAVAAQHARRELGGDHRRRATRSSARSGRRGRSPAADSRLTTVPSATPSQRPQSASAASAGGLARLRAPDAARRPACASPRESDSPLPFDARRGQQRLQAGARLQAAARAARARQPVVLDGRVAELAAEPAVAAEQLAAEHDARRRRRSRPSSTRSR